jgi:hypothetical protein
VQGSQQGYGQRSYNWEQKVSLPDGNCIELIISLATLPGKSIAILLLPIPYVYVLPNPYTWVNLLQVTIALNVTELAGLIDFDPARQPAGRELPTTMVGWACCICPYLLAVTS